MILVRPSYKIMQVYGMNPHTSPLCLIEKAGRTCYKSGDIVTNETSKEFTKMILKRGHESVIEHSAMTVKFICDRGVSHEIVRHRLCAFSQESTRYCNYKGGVTFVMPPWCKDLPYFQVIEPERSYFGNICSTSKEWIQAMRRAEKAYIKLLSLGWSPQQARSILPNSLKTEIIVTANFREWRHIFRLRCQKAAHPQMREIMIPLLEECKKTIPVIFDDIEVN